MCKHIQIGSKCLNIEITVLEIYEFCKQVRFVAENSENKIILLFCLQHMCSIFKVCSVRFDQLDGLWSLLVLEECIVENRIAYVKVDTGSDLINSAPQVTALL